MILFMPIGGHINIAQVYTDDGKLEEKLQSTLDYFVKEGSSLLKLKCSEDVDGEVWIEKNINENESLNPYLTNYFLTFEISGEAWKSNIDKFHLSISQEDGYYGFLMSMEWNSIFKVEENKNVQVITSSIMKVMKDLCRHTHYDYVVIGHEIEIEIPPLEFVQIIKEADYYPVAMVPLNGALKIYRGEIGIDGMTKQPVATEIIEI